MSEQDLREAVARVIDPWAWSIDQRVPNDGAVMNRFDRQNAAKRRDASLAKADAILALISTKGGEDHSSVACGLMPVSLPVCRTPEATPLSAADSCEVTVRVNGDEILTIGVLSGYLAGVSDIERYGEFVRACGEHLLAFIGPAEPPPCWFCGGAGEVMAPDRDSGPVPCDMCQWSEEDFATKPDDTREGETGEASKPTEHKAPSPPGERR